MNKEIIIKEIRQSNDNCGCMFNGNGQTMFVKLSLNIPNGNARTGLNITVISHHYI